MSLLNTWLQSLDYEFEILNHCTKIVSPHSSCTKCMDCCESNAITIQNQKAHINKEVCTDCAKCIVACPVQAVAGIFPKRTFNNDKLLADNDKLPSTKELLIYYKNGIKTIVTTELETTSEWFTIIDEANEQLAQMDYPPFVLEEQFTPKQQQISRRDLFSLWKTEGKSIAKEIAPAKWRFNQEDFNLNKYYTEFQFHSIQLDPTNCIACRACEKLCPDKCFTMQDNIFSIETQKCKGCMLCVDICLEKAIKIEPTIAQAKVYEYAIHKHKCPTCRQSHISFSEESTECFICQKKKNTQFNLY